MGAQPGNCGGQGQGQGQAQGQGTVNPITGIRARRGGIYETLLNSVGVRNNAGQDQVQDQGQVQGQVQDQGQVQAQGTVNPLTGIRARRGGIYETLLNGIGVRGNQGGGGVGLLGNNPLVRAINARGGLLAVSEQNSSPPIASQSTMPGWAVAGIVLLCVVLVGTVAVMVQLALIIRRS